uniref:Neugrin n=1 Tax=Neolamprologus brichardi TaxID=32507 RepID=A0A3Q4GVA6_NEOBR
MNQTAQMGPGKIKIQTALAMACKPVGLVHYSFKGRDPPTKQNSLGMALALIQPWLQQELCLGICFREERKRQKTVKYHILRRQMTPSGAPERRLTWDAIEQIRHLKQNQPDEWTVERLAEGFSVSHDVILRVLRSKFVPSPERKAKQNAKVMAKMSQQVLPSGARTQQDRLKLPERNSQAILPPGSTEGALIPVANQTQVIQGHGSRSLAKSLVPVTVQPTHIAAGISEDATDEESWDGQVLTEEELEEFVKMEKPSPAVQVGNDFFDADGNFLYRI